MGWCSLAVQVGDCMVGRCGDQDFVASGHRRKVGAGKGLIDEQKEWWRWPFRGRQAGRWQGGRKPELAKQDGEALGGWARE